MAILQTQIDTLITEVSANEETLALIYSVGGLNGIRNVDTEEDIVKLQTILDQLQCYDLVNYADTYFYDLRREANKVCDGVTTSSTLTTPPNITNTYFSRILQSLTTAGTGAGIDSGFTLPSRSSYNFVDVTLVGYNRMTMGDGSKTEECYWSADSGTTAKAIISLVVGDKLYINASVLGFAIATSDQIEIILL